MIYLRPEYVVRCEKCGKTVVLDSRSPRDEHTNTWDMLVRDLATAGWSFVRRGGYVFEETCPGPHTSPRCQEPQPGGSGRCTKEANHVGAHSNGVDIWMGDTST